LIFIGLLTPSVTVWIAVVRVMTIRQFFGWTPLGQAGALIALLGAPTTTVPPKVLPSGGALLVTAHVVAAATRRPTVTPPTGRKRLIGKD
jgi:hypothetical protein